MMQNPLLSSREAVQSFWELKRLLRVEFGETLSTDQPNLASTIRSLSQRSSSPRVKSLSSRLLVAFTESEEKVVEAKAAQAAIAAASVEHTEKRRQRVYRGRVISE